MPIYTATAVYFLYQACLKIKLSNAWLVVPFVLFQAYFYGTTRSSLAVPLAAIIICFGFYFLVEKKWLWFALVGGLLPLARLELSPLLILWLFALLKDKQWKFLILLGLPTLLWNLGGTLLNGDPIWLYTETFGTDNGENRYGNTEFNHYFLRFIFVIGPVIFYFMLIGFFQDLFKKKMNPFIHIQFLLGFFIYVLSSWKLSLGQAAGFLRHLIVLAPLVAIIALNGFNYTLLAIFKPTADGELDTEPILDKKDEEEKSDLLKKIEEIESQRDSGKIKNRQAKYLINELNSKIKLLNQEEVNQPIAKKDSGSSNRIVITALSIIIPLITFFFLSNKIEYHHNLLEVKDYTNFYIVSGFSLIVILLLYIPKLGQLSSLRNSYIGLVLATIIGFTLITEPPNTHDSHERRVMSKLARIYSNSYLTNYPTYNNHYWVSWISGIDQSKFQLTTIENLEKAADSSIVIWDSHYSDRLAGNVPETYFNDKPEYIELVNLWSDKLTFNVRIYQKIKNGKDLSSLSANERLIAFYPNSSEPLASKAQRLYNFGKVAEAEKFFKEAISLNPSDLYVISNYGNLLFEQKRYEEAIVVYKANMEQNPIDYTGYYNIGLNYLKLQQYDSAIVNFTQSIKSNSDNGNPYLQRGNCYFKMELYQEALNDFKSYVLLEPNKAVGYFNQGVTKVRMHIGGCAEFYRAYQLNHPRAAEALQLDCKDYIPN